MQVANFVILFLILLSFKQKVMTSEYLMEFVVHVSDKFSLISFLFIQVLKEFDKIDVWCQNLTLTYSIIKNSAFLCQIIV